MKTFFRILTALCLVSLTGCFPVERFWWSPDGTHAIVMAGDEPQLHLVQATGELGAPIAKLQIHGDLPVGVAWLPDGSGFVLARTQAKATWADTKALLPADEIVEIERFALGIPHLLQAAAAMAGNAEEVEDLLHTVSGHDRALLTAAFFQAREQQKAAVDAALLAGPKGAELLERVNAEATPYRVHEICLVKVNRERTPGEPQSVARSIREMLLPKVSPKFPAIAYCKALSDEKNVALEVATLDGKSRMHVRDSSAPVFDWSSDGRALIVAAAVSGGDSFVQTIRRETVLQASGALQEENRDASDLAVAIMPTAPRLCVLPDDRVLFASQPAKLPAVSGALALAPRLYLVSADGKSISEVPTAPGDLPANLSFFVVSPDGRRVAVVESDTVAVAVVELATGKTEIISPPHEGWSCRTVPAWKSASELTFAGLDPSPGTPKWMIWKSGEGVRPLSESWPVSATQAWLEKKGTSKTAAENP